jgi:hypothetical protein
VFITCGSQYSASKKLTGSTALLTVFRSHVRSCGHTSRSYRRCKCPIHLEGSLAGEKIRKALDLTSWEAAQELVRMWEAEGKVQPEKKRIAIREAVQRYLEDAAARHLKEGTLRRLKVILYDRLLSYSDEKGLRYPEELSRDELRRFNLALCGAD